MFSFFPKSSTSYSRPRTPARGMLFLLVVAAVAFAFWQNSKQVNIINTRMSIYDPSALLDEPARKQLRGLIADFKERHQVELFVDLSDKDLASSPSPLDKVKTMVILLHINPKTGVATVLLSPLLKRALPQSDAEDASKALAVEAQSKKYEAALKKAIAILDNAILRLEGTGMSGLNTAAINT